MGFFITFEGIEGCGKTTQINHLTAYFKEKSLPIFVDPGARGNGDRRSDPPDPPLLGKQPHGAGYGVFPLCGRKSPAYLSGCSPRPHGGKDGSLRSVRRCDRCLPGLWKGIEPGMDRGNPRPLSKRSETEPDVSPRSSGGGRAPAGLEENGKSDREGRPLRERSPGVSPARPGRISRPGPERTKSDHGFGRDERRAVASPGNSNHLPKGY